MYNYTVYDSDGIYGIARTSMLIGLIIAAVGIVAMWKIFTKAGKEGWIAIIPFYNAYTLFEITWGKGVYFLLLFVGIIPIVGGLAELVIVIMTLIKLGKSFGKSSGFIVGLILLSPIFQCMLAFDDSEYLGVISNNNSQANNNQVYNSQPQQNSQPSQEVQQPQNMNTTNEAPSAPPTQTAAFCPNCGAPFSQDSAFCTKCGKPRS